MPIKHLKYSNSARFGTNRLNKWLLRFRQSTEFVWMEGDDFHN